MKLTSIDFGEALAWILAVIFVLFGILDVQTFILFVLLKFSFKLTFKE